MVTKVLLELLGTSCVFVGRFTFVVYYLEHLLVNVF